MIDILNKVKALDGSKSVLNIFSDTSDEDDYWINLNALYLITSLRNDDEQKILYEYIIPVSFFVGIISFINKVYDSFLQLTPIPSTSIRLFNSTYFGTFINIVIKIIVIRIAKYFFIYIYLLIHYL